MSVRCWRAFTTPIWECLSQNHNFSKKVKNTYFVTKQDSETSSDKVKVIRDFKQPSNLFELRSALGLAGYYSCFIKDFAAIARHLTSLLKGEGGKVSKYSWKNIPVSFDESLTSEFNKLRNILTSSSTRLKLRLRSYSSSPRFLQTVWIDYWCFCNCHSYKETDL